MTTTAGWSTTSPTPTIKAKSPDELPASFFVEQQVAVANKKDTDYLEDRFGITRQIVLSLVDADGTRLLTEDDRGRVDELPRKDVLKLARAIMEANFEPPAEDGGDEKTGRGNERDGHYDHRPFSRPGTPLD